VLATDEGKILVYYTLRSQPNLFSLSFVMAS
jgi:hypothetical protein